MNNDSHLPRMDHSIILTANTTEKTKNIPRKHTELPGTTSGDIKRFQQVHFSGQNTMEHLTFDILPLQGTTCCIEVRTLPKLQAWGRQQHR
mmetsp:Transcript_5610/g.19624  ORF Transcript_5610/g.19624 Transcript_5610/m.19624 type:complete len:91 (+) Transcript_5610:153-425(+)